MPSILYDAVFQKGVPLTGLFIEHLGIKVAEAGGITEENTYNIISTCLRECGLVRGEATQEQVSYVINELNSIAEEQEEKKDQYRRQTDNQDKGVP